ncbi:hypothetical protein WUBG_17759 [Wuchereria bancrofti]|uniref:Uncharacterized protein n=1 Tax=Wuchereria bancrofti TaxID=6293 RepID=J9DNX0_WUCBA|nr:hypothetical protein WUBG_17759 [Wuchereria bancrofti]
MEEDVRKLSSPHPSPIPPVDNLKYLSVSPPRSCASLTVRATARAANEISTRFVVCEITQFIVKDSRTSQYDVALPNRPRQYTVDAVATTSASSSSPELIPSVTTNTTSGGCSRKFLEAVPEVDAVNVFSVVAGNGTATSKEKTEVGRNITVGNIQSLMEEDVRKLSSPHPSPIPPVDNLKYLSVSPPRS